MVVYILRMIRFFFGPSELSDYQRFSHQLNNRGIYIGGYNHTVTLDHPKYTVKYIIHITYNI